MLENKTKSCKVTIFGDNYSLVTNESHDHIVQAAQMVDVVMKEIAQKAATIEDKKCAVLAALRIASKVLLLESEIVQSKQKNEQLIEAIDQELNKADVQATL